MVTILYHFLLYSTNYHISVKFAVSVDGHLHALSFDILQGTFLTIFSFSADMSLSDKCVTFVGRCHFLGGNNRFWPNLAVVFTQIICPSGYCPKV